MKVKVVTNILKANARIARRTGARCTSGDHDAQPHVLPGRRQDDAARAHDPRLGARLRFGVIEGDIQGTHDAEVIAALGVR